MSKKLKKRIGRLVITGYIVDMDNNEQVEHATEAFLEDIYQACVKSGDNSELASMIEVLEDKKLKEKDIPDFLIEEDE